MKILFFDGYCSLCNSFVDFMIRLDRRQKIKFASLQGETAKKYLPASMLTSTQDPETILYFHDGHIDERSTGILNGLRDMGGPWPLIATVLFIIPRPLRDGIYRIVARNRYRLFGRRETCRLPTPEEKERLLP